MHPVVTENGSEVKITLRSYDGTISAGGRFKYIAPEIGSTYEDLVKALNDAIDKEAELTGNKFVTNDRNIAPVTEEIDFDALVKECNDIVTELSRDGEEKMTEYWMPRIQQITNKYLGKGKKVSACTRDQGEQLQLIVIELRELLKTK